MSETLLLSHTEDLGSTHHRLWYYDGTLSNFNLRKYNLCTISRTFDFVNNIPGRVLYVSHTLSAHATAVSQAQSVHASRDLFNAVTFSYLLSLIRIPCRHLHLIFSQAQSVHASKIFRKPMQSVHASRDYQTQPLFTCISVSNTLCLIRIPCRYCININTRLSYQPSQLHLYDRKL